MKKQLKRSIYSPSNVHLRSADNEESTGRTIEGYAILFNSPSVAFVDDVRDEVREVVAPEAITREVLDASDIKMTMFHDNQLILARSKRGEGTLSYFVDDKGVGFSFEAPNTEDGNKALELVKRGDIDGCSFAFSTYYTDSDYVSEEIEMDESGKRHTTYTVRAVTGIYDFTLTPDPAYEQTSVEARALGDAIKAREAEKEANTEKEKTFDVSEVNAVRVEANKKII